MFVLVRETSARLLIYHKMLELYDTCFAVCIITFKSVPISKDSSFGGPVSDGQVHVPGGQDSVRALDICANHIEVVC